MPFTPRLEKPVNNKYYITIAAGGYSTAIVGNPTDSSCNTLANCVGYAAGRFNEIIGKGKFLYLNYPPNAEDFYKTAQEQGLKVGSEPKLGAIICWRLGNAGNPDDGAGHVAVVEQINQDGTILTSESGYGCTPSFWTSKRNKGADCNWGGGNFIFQGFIYQPEEVKPLMLKGVDISYCQTQITWEEVDIDFAIIKAGQRDFTDPMFESHYKGATQRGIPVGAYWYLDKSTLTEEAAVKEADQFLLRLKGKKFPYPVFLDLESEEQFRLGKSKCSALMRAFLQRVEKAGYWVGLYGNLSSLTYYTEDDIKQRYSIWLAQWDIQQPTYQGAYGIWQYGVEKTKSNAAWEKIRATVTDKDEAARLDSMLNSGKASQYSLPGIKGDVDVDYCYVDYPTKIKEKGLNGYGKEPEPPPTPKETKDVTLIMDGTKWSGTLTKE